MASTDPSDTYLHYPWTTIVNPWRNIFQFMLEEEEGVGGKDKMQRDSGGVTLHLWPYNFTESLNKEIECKPHIILFKWPTPHVNYVALCKLHGLHKLFTILSVIE